MEDGKYIPAMSQYLGSLLKEDTHSVIDTLHISVVKGQLCELVNETYELGEQLSNIVKANPKLPNTFNTDMIYVLKCQAEAIRYLDTIPENIQQGDYMWLAGNMHDFHSWVVNIEAQRTQWEDALEREGLSDEAN